MSAIVHNGNGWGWIGWFRLLSHSTSMHVPVHFHYLLDLHSFFTQRMCSCWTEYGQYIIGYKKRQRWTCSSSIPFLSHISVTFVSLICQLAALSNWLYLYYYYYYYYKLTLLLSMRWPLFIYTQKTCAYLVSFLWNSFLLHRSVVYLHLDFIVFLLFRASSVAIFGCMDGMTMPIPDHSWNRITVPEACLTPHIISYHLIPSLISSHPIFIPFIQYFITLKAMPFVLLGVGWRYGCRYLQFNSECEVVSGMEWLFRSDEWCNGNGSLRAARADSTLVREEPSRFENRAIGIEMQRDTTKTPLKLAMIVLFLDCWVLPFHERRHAWYSKASRSLD